MLLPVFTSLLILFLGQVRSEDVAPCAVGCVDGVFANSINLGCAAGDQLCLCAKTTDMTDGIRDCVNSACGSDAAAQAPLAQTYGSNQCQAASSKAGLLAAATPTPTPSPATAQEQAATTPTTAAAETAEASPSPSPSPSADASPSPSPSPATQAVAAASPSTSDATAEATSPTSASASTSDAASTTAAAGSSSSSSVSAYITAGTSVGSAAAAKNSDDASSSDDGSGLTTAAKGGIGAGVGAAVIVATVIACCLCMRRRQKKKRDAEIRARSLQISQPLPGSGRQYADNMRQAEAGLSRTFTTTSAPRIGEAVSSPSPTSRVAEKVSPESPPMSPSTTASYYSELDHNLRRYEEMTPQTQPRTMI
ncbi:hypothetical protein F5B20DRAFT_154188 [Whalleya microplaca]|nr:hypothetical protein F5B20DRAFT_154188 [Whalleya microplaca]